MAHTELLGHGAGIILAPACLHKYELRQRYLLREFLELERLHSRRETQSCSEVNGPNALELWGKPKCLYFGLAVAMSTVLLIELILVIGDTSLSLLSKFTLPFMVGTILLTTFTGMGIYLPMAKLISKTINLRLTERCKEENMRSKVRRKDSGREVVRFQFEIDPDLWNELERFQQEGGLTTKRELLNNALTLFKWAAQHKERGNSINASGPNGTIYELEMPVLESIELNSQRKIRLASVESDETVTTASAA